MRLIDLPKLCWHALKKIYNGEIKKMSRPNTPDELLQSPEICVLSTVNPDGSVHAMPMWYLYEDDKIWFMTGSNSQKVKNVERTGHATVTLDLREKPYYAIMIKGEAKVGEPIDRAMQKRVMTRYITESDADNYIAKLESRGGNASIVVTPKKTIEFRS